SRRSRPYSFPPKRTSRQPRSLHLLFPSGRGEIRAMPNPILTLGTYQARPGCEEELSGILRTHVARLGERGLSADRPYFAAARAGEDPRACAELARRYRAGDGVARDLVKAVRAARDGCEAGEPALCVEAGRAILRGEGLKPDPELARRLFGDACTHRARAGCLDLALMLQNGDGVAQDPAQATSLFEQACQGGEAAACSLYGDARYMGGGAPKDARAAEAAY